MSTTTASLSTSEVNGGISRSGRIRKKTAKMMEMEETDITAPPVTQNTRQTSNTKKKPFSSASVTPMKIKITIGGNEVTDNGTANHFHSLTNGGSTAEQVAEEEVSVFDDFQCEEVLRDDGEALQDKETVNNHLLMQSPVKTSNTSTESPSCQPSLKMKFNLSKGIAEMQTSSHKTAKTVSSPVVLQSVTQSVPTQTLSPPTKKARLLQSVPTQVKDPEPESEANKLFKQIAAGVLTPSTVKKTPAIMLSYDNLPSMPVSGYNSTTAATTSTEAKSDKPKKSSSSPKRPFVTGYTLWSRENRPKVQMTFPEMDFPTVSKKLGEIWQTISKQEKYQWKLKADKLKQSPGFVARKEQYSENKNGVIPAVKTPLTVGPKVVRSGDAGKATFKKTKRTTELYDDPAAAFPFIPHGTVRQTDGLSPLDVGSHLKLIGDTLSSMGRKMQLGQYPLGSGDAVNGEVSKRSEAKRSDLTSLLDGTLCAVSSLLTLTTRHPMLDGCPQEIHNRILDNLSYIMPGI